LVVLIEESLILAKLFFDSDEEKFSLGGVHG